MTYSDPVSIRAGQANQIAQNSIYLSRGEFPYLYPSGRLHEAAQYYHLEFTWLDDGHPPVGLESYYVPSIIERVPLVKFVPSVLLVDWVRDTLPILAYTRAHFVGQERGLEDIRSGTPADELVPNHARFYLHYATGFDDYAPVQFLGTVPQDGITQDIDDTYDSFCVQASSSEDQTPPAPTGWVISLVRQEFKSIPNQDIPELIHHVFGIWTLPRPDDNQPQPIWNPSVATTWTIIQNNLLLAPHTLRLTPLLP